MFSPGVSEAVVGEADLRAEPPASGRKNSKQNKNA